MVAPRSRRGSQKPRNRGGQLRQQRLLLVSRPKKRFQRDEGIAGGGDGRLTEGSASASSVESDVHQHDLTGRSPAMTRATMLGTVNPAELPAHPSVSTVQPHGELSRGGSPHSTFKRRGGNRSALRMVRPDMRGTPHDVNRPGLRVARRAILEVI
jgi:hypothetical protein